MNFQAAKLYDVAYSMYVIATGVLPHIQQLPIHQILSNQTKNPHILHLVKIFCLIFISRVAETLKLNVRGLKFPSACPLLLDFCLMSPEYFHANFK